MGRRREFDEAAALRAVEAVFWRKGFEGATYAELMAETGLGKGSLYAAFDDKVALYRRVLTAYVEREIGRIGEILFDPGVAPRDRISAALDEAILPVERDGDRRGCFLCNAAIEVGAADAETAALIEASMAQAQTAFSAAAAEAGVAGGHFFAVYLGLRVMARAGAPATTLRQARDDALRPAPTTDGATPP